LILVGFVFFYIKYFTTVGCLYFEHFALFMQRLSL